LGLFVARINGKIGVSASGYGQFIAAVVFFVAGMALYPVKGKIEFRCNRIVEQP
jgi:hypothetical protein